MTTGWRRWALTGVRWIVTLALLGGLLYGTRQLLDTAKRRGEAEAAEDVARSGPRVRATTTIVAATSTSSGSPAAAASSVPPTTPPPLTGEPEPLRVARIDASVLDAPQPDSCGRTVTYDPGNAVDGNLSTAWRVAGDGTGDTLQLTLAAPAHLTEVGLVPGYAKIDLCSGFDRFPQLRRITAVTWRFDGGVTVQQIFKDRAEVQSLPVDVVSATIVVEITGVTPAPQLDATAISEVRLVGVPGA